MVLEPLRPLTDHKKMRARQCSKSLLILFGLSGTSRLVPAKQSFFEARPARFEPATHGLEERGGMFAGVSRD